MCIRDRPQTLDDYIGQKKVTDNLKIFIEAAKLRKEPLDHVSVSYTHLDVYKRQAAICGRWVIQMI